MASVKVVRHHEYRELRYLYSQIFETLPSPFSLTLYTNVTIIEKAGDFANFNILLNNLTLF